MGWYSSKENRRKTVAEYLRVLLGLHHYLNPNQGAPGATLALGKALQAFGCCVEYYGFDQAYPRKNYGEIRNALQFPWRLSDFLAKNSGRFDVIDVSTGDNWVWAKKGRPGSRKHPILVTRSHGLEHTVDANVRQDASDGLGKLSWKYPLYHGGFRLWEVAASLRQADLSLMLNQHDLDYAAGTLGVKRGKMRLVANGIPDSFLGLPYQSVGGDNSVSPLTIAQIGTYIPRKGIAYGDKALNTVLAHHKNVHVAFFGTGCPEAQVLTDFVPSVQAQVKVTPKYSRENLPSLIKDAQVMLFPSLSEGFSLALPEAMACGLAPIVTKIPGNIEIAHDNDNALLVPARDSDAIEQALKRLINDRSLLEQIRRRAYLTAQNYSWGRIAAETLDLYEETLRATSRP